jgi:superfamily I DNA/RNA helicase/mRNA-degrading endonuclease RelE of RelBE toxin-antitoxin system
VDFRIADTFLASLARLTGDEQKAVKTTAFDLQMDPVNPGMQLHKLDRAKDKRFWSARVGRDIRLIVHRTSSNFLLCYVGHHDDAYAWAERRKLETHPTTGAAQLVEIRERVREIEVPRAVPTKTVSAPPLFADRADDELLGFGVPAEWLEDVRRANEASLLDLAEHLPAEAAEALLELAVGGTPTARETVGLEPRLPVHEPEVPVFPAAAAEAQPSPEAEIAAEAFEHPDALRRFHTVADAEELERALSYPWDRWTVFLHPSQRELVEREYAGPARISGAAGTGKTIVALHRAVHLANRHPDARVLLTTISEPLAAALRTQLRRLVSDAPRLGERLEVHALDEIAVRLHTLNFAATRIIPRDEVLAAIRKARAEAELPSTSLSFLEDEWEQVVDAWQIETWEVYRDAPRLGRRTRLTEDRRAALWSVLSAAAEHLRATGQTTLAGVYGRLSSLYRGGAKPPFDFVVVDEAQDLTVPQLRFLSTFGADRPDGLFLTGDLGQRIFQLPFSWKALGVDVSGRSHTLRVNYRMSHQIRAATDELLPPEISDVDGNVESREATISVFNGSEPEIVLADDDRAEIASVADWLVKRTGEGYAPHELAIFIRSAQQADRAIAALIKASLPYVILDERLKTRGGFASLATMHVAKGLEFRGVAVMACDDEVIPLQSRIDTIADPGDLEDMYNTERHLLYVACTRARDRLLVSGVKPGSEFLEDLGDSAFARDASGSSATP